MRSRRRVMMNSTSLLLTLLINALWQTPLLMIVALGCDRLIRPARPAERLRIWVTGLLLSLLLPLLSLRLAITATLTSSSSPLVKLPIADDNGIWLGELLNRHSQPLRLQPSLVTIAITIYLLWLTYRSIRLLRAWQATRALH